MNVKKFLPLIVAAGLGLVALVIAHSGIGRDTSKAVDKTVHVIVAKEAVAPGQSLTPDNLIDQAIAGTTVPPGAHTQMSELYGRVTIAPIVPGQSILDAFLAAPEALQGLPALIPMGMRAVTIDVSETTGVAGLIAPGARVDIVSVLNQGEKEKTCARTICSNVPVVAVGQRMSANRPEGDTSMARTVTLLCKPREAELIKLAYTSSNTSLVLRGNGDSGPADSRGVMFTDLAGAPPEVRMPKPVVDVGDHSASKGPTTLPDRTLVMAMPAPSKVWRVEVIDGGKVSQVSLDLPDNDNSGSTDPDNYGISDQNPLIPNQK